jgi:hypothetical protein
LPRSTDFDSRSGGADFRRRRRTGAGNHFAFRAIGDVAAGSAFAFTVTAEDQFDNPVGAYDGTVQFASGDRQATLPSDGTLVGGIGNFVATLRTAGVQNLVVTDTGDGAISGTHLTTLPAEIGRPTALTTRHPPALMNVSLSTRS